MHVRSRSRRRNQDLHTQSSRELVVAAIPVALRHYVGRPGRPANEQSCTRQMPRNELCCGGQRSSTPAAAPAPESVDAVVRPQNELCCGRQRGSTPAAAPAPESAAAVVRFVVWFAHQSSQGGGAAVKMKAMRAFQAISVLRAGGVGCRCRKLYALWPRVAGRQVDSASPYPALSSGARCGDGVLHIIDNVMACGQLGYRSRPIAAAWHKAGIVCCCPTLLNITPEVRGICLLCLSMEPRVLMGREGGRGELRSRRRVEMRYGKRRFGQRVYPRYQERF